MKKIMIIFLLVSFNIITSDLTTEINAKYTSDFSHSETPVTLKVSGEYSKENTYAQFELKGDNQTEEIEFSKAYGEIYKENFIVTAGRQPISWGNAYIFNRLAVLNEINLLNPSDKTNTLDGIKLKLNRGNNNRIEGIIFNIDNNSDNYALRYTTLIHNSELMLNYIKKNSSKDILGSEDINDFVVDLKGDFKIGLWSQYAYNFDYNKSFFLMGTDYSFSLWDNTLYLLWEGSYKEKDKLFLNYCRYEYGIDQWNSVLGGLMSQKNNILLTTSLSHKLNDEAEIKLSHIYVHPDNDSAIGKSLKKNYGKNNIELEIKIVF